jgi:hypothetical protein
MAWPPTSYMMISIFSPPFWLNSRTVFERLLMSSPECMVVVSTSKDWHAISQNHAINGTFSTISSLSSSTSRSSVWQLTTTSRKHGIAPRTCTKADRRAAKTQFATHRSSRSQSNARLMILVHQGPRTSAMPPPLPVLMESTPRSLLIGPLCLLVDGTEDRNSCSTLA